MHCSLQAFRHTNNYRLAVWAISLVAAFPQQAAALSFEQALHLSTQGAPTLAASQAKVDWVRTAAISAGELPDPKLAVGVENFPIGVLSRNRRKFRQPINVACPAPGRWGRPNSRVTSRHFDHGNASRTSRPDCSGLDEAD